MSPVNNIKLSREETEQEIEPFSSKHLKMEQLQIKAEEQVS